MHRKTLLQQQITILIMILLGTMEEAAWFFLYFDLNAGGSALCCPMYSGLYVAVVIGGVKKAVRL